MVWNFLLISIIFWDIAFGQDVSSCKTTNGQTGMCYNANTNDPNCKLLTGTIDRGSCKEGQICCPANNILPPSSLNSAMNLNNPFSSLNNPFNSFFPPQSSSNPNLWPSSLQNQNPFITLPPSTYQNVPFPFNFPQNPFNTPLSQPNSPNFMQNPNSDSLAAMFNLMNSNPWGTPSGSSSFPNSPPSNNMNLPGFPFNSPTSTNQDSFSGGNMNPFLFNSNSNNPSNVAPPQLPNFFNPGLPSSSSFPFNPFSQYNLNSFSTNSKGQSCGSTRTNPNSLMFSPRILEGSPANQNIYCFQVIIFDGSNQYLGGGVLIHPFWIVTTASIIKRAKDEHFLVVLGDPTGSCRQTLYTSNSIINKKYNVPNSKSENNIALLKLLTPADTSQTCICTVCLPDPNETYFDKVCTVSGYGATSEQGNYPTLPMKFITVSVLQKPACQLMLWINRVSFNIDDSQICALGSNGQDSCRGDGGGPLVCMKNNVPHLVGLISIGFACGQNVPSLYTNVSHMTDFFKEVGL